MPQPAFDEPKRDEWDEHDWERFLQCADARAARFQELFETLRSHPRRDQIISREMGWAEALQECGEDRDCAACDERFECEVYGMLCLVAEPERIENDPDAEALTACFEQLHGIPAYCCAHDFVGCLEKTLHGRFSGPGGDDARNALSAGQMVPAQIAGGHGIGYERDSLCGNIANCKRALRSLTTCTDYLTELEASGLLTPAEVQRLAAEAGKTSREINDWIDALRAKIWWR